MSVPLILITVLAIGGLFVFLPMASRHRYRRIVKCPETDEPAEILIDASYVPSSRPRKKPWSIRGCSLWPKRKGCTETCLREPETRSL